MDPYLVLEKKLLSLSFTSLNFSILSLSYFATAFFFNLSPSCATKHKSRLNFYKNIRTNSCKPTKTLATENLPETLPLLTLDDRIVFPNVVVPVVVPEGEFAQLIEDNIADRQLVALGYPIGGDLGKKKDDKRFLPFATLGRVLKMLRMQDSSIRLLIQGISRIRLDKVRREGKLFLCCPQTIKMPGESPVEFIAPRKALLLLFHEMIELNPTLSDDLRSASEMVETAGELADFIMANIDLPLEA